MALRLCEVSGAGGGGVRANSGRPRPQASNLTSKRGRGSTTTWSYTHVLNQLYWWLAVSASCPLYNHKLSYYRVYYIGLEMSLLTYFRKLSNQKEEPEV